MVGVDQEVGRGWNTSHRRHDRSARGHARDAWSELEALRDGQRQMPRRSPEAEMLQLFLARLRETRGGSSGCFG